MLAQGLSSGVAVVEAQKRHKKKPRHIDIETLRASQSRSTAGEKARAQEIRRITSPTHRVEVALSHRVDPAGRNVQLYALNKAGLLHADEATRDVGQAVSSLLFAPVGAYETGKAVGLDVRDTTRGDFAFDRSRAIAAAMGKQLVEDVRHPRRNAGYLAVDVLGLIGGGAGVESRLASGTRAATVAGRHAATRSLLDEGVATKGVHPLDIGSGGTRKHAFDTQYAADLGRIESVRETVERRLSERRPVPEQLLSEYADVAKRYVVGTTSRTKAFRRGFAQPEKRGLEFIGVKEPRLLTKTQEEELTRMEGELGAIFEGMGEHPTVRSDFALTREAGRGGGAVGIVKTAIREASEGAKAGAIYLRPAYLPNNWLGNTAFNLIHQGFLAPVNIAKSFALHRVLDETELNVLDHTLGQGVTLGVHGGGASYVRAATGPLTRAVHKAADAPFRRAALLHELRRQGYRTLAQVKTLIRDAETNPRARRALVKAAHTAEEEVVRFGRLSEHERGFVRHLFFIWNWTRGASRYAARFPAKHPVNLAAQVQLGRLGEERVADTLGDVPDWMRGFIPYSVDEQGDPTLGNPLNISPLGTALSVLTSAEGTAKSLITGEKQQTDLTDLLNPLIRAGLEAREGKPLVESLQNTVALSRLGGQLVNPGQGQTFPGTRAEAIGNFALGSLYPRKASGAAIKEQASKEDRSAMSAGQRAEDDFNAKVSRAQELFKGAGLKLPPIYRELAERKYHYDEAQRALKEDLGVDRLDEAHKVSALIALANTIPELRSHHDGFISAMHAAEGDPRDAGETPSGPMAQLRAALERALGFGALEKFSGVLNKLEDQQQVKG